MLSFSNFLIERYDLSKAMADAYESATALHVHNNTAAKDNQDPAYLSSIENVRKTHSRAMAILPPEIQKKALVAAEASGRSYLQSLETNHGYKPSDIEEVHHTNLGIDQHLGRQVDRAQNPHDILVKGTVKKKPFMHGASLKATEGTASNNPAAAFDRNSGLDTNLASIWKSGRETAGLSGMTDKQIKLVRDNPEIKQANKDTQQMAANNHAEKFNIADLEKKKQHLKWMLKMNPDLKYDYVTGDRGGAATPIENKAHLKAIMNAKNIVATVSNNRVNFHDERGNHIAYTEHRPTHGSFVSPQANGKFGKLK